MGLSKKLGYGTLNSYGLYWSIIISPSKSISFLAITTFLQRVPRFQPKILQCLPKSPCFMGINNGS